MSWLLLLFCVRKGRLRRDQTEEKSGSKSSGLINSVTEVLSDILFVLLICHKDLFDSTEYFVCISVGLLFYTVTANATITKQYILTHLHSTINFNNPPNTLYIRNILSAKQSGTCTLESKRHLPNRSRYLNYLFF